MSGWCSIAEEVKFYFLRCPCAILCLSPVRYNGVCCAHKSRDDYLLPFVLAMEDLMNVESEAIHQVLYNQHERRQVFAPKHTNEILD